MPLTIIYKITFMIFYIHSNIDVNNKHNHSNEKSQGLYYVQFVDDN